MLFANKRTISKAVADTNASGAPTTVADLIADLTQDLQSRHQNKDMFVLNGSMYKTPYYLFMRQGCADGT